MKTLTKLSLATMLALGMAFSAQALSITPTSGVLNTTRWEGTQNSQSQINTAIAPIIGAATERYKQNAGGSEEGSLAGSYATSFSPNAGDASGATITYSGGTSVGPNAYLLVKDGNHSPAWYLFNLTALGWNGTAQLDLSGFWTAQGAISHVTLYGGGGTTTVPDAGGTLALLGLAIGTLGLARRKFGV